MVCQNCKKREATFHSTSNVNGFITEEHLCNECAHILGKLKSTEKMFDFNDFLSMEDSFVSEVKKCKFCGTNLTEILDRGFVGCSHCYEQFKHDLDKIIQKVQGHISHKGKTLSPNNSKIQKLENDLKKAVAEHRYEDASKIDSEINKLKKEEADDGIQ